MAFKLDLTCIKIKWYTKFQINMSKHVGEKCGKLWRTDGDPDGRTDGHHHTIIRPVWRRAYKNQFSSSYHCQPLVCFVPRRQSMTYLLTHPTTQVWLHNYIPQRMLQGDNNVTDGGALSQGPYKEIIIQKLLKFLETWSKFKVILTNQRCDQHCNWQLKKTNRLKKKNNMPRSLIQEHKARLYYSNHKSMHLPLDILIVN